MSGTTPTEDDWAAWYAWRAWRHRQILRGLLKWGLVGLIWLGLAATLFVLWSLRDLPRPEAALDAVRRPSLVIQDATGATIATYGDRVGEPLRLTDLPPYVPQAAVAVEDRRFWDHGAIDPIGILRAAGTDLLHARVVQGGSTIAQQVAKTLFLSNARTWRRKIQELALTFWLERTFTKPQILEIWLNRVYFGQGASGIDAAAHVYFGISARHLGLWQAAMLAGLPRAPSRFNPRANPQAAAARAGQVLQAMVETHAITDAQRQAAIAAIDLHRPARHALGGGWFADWIAAGAETLLPPDQDATLRTTLQPQLQARTESDLDTMLDSKGEAAHVSQGAVVVLDAHSGAVLAMAGGRNYAASPYNLAVEARRQPGSAFKPFVFLAALNRGVTPSSPVDDAPIRVGSYRPQDFSRRYLGTITVEEALALSINTAAVRLLLRAGGPRAVAATAARLGIADTLPDDASLALGSGGVGLLEMAGAYASFCNGGHRITPYGTEFITTGGHTEQKIADPGPVVIPPDQDAMMQQMLAAVVARGTGTRAAIPGHDVMGKTGTTQDFRDAWFIGCIDRRRVVAVWLGNDDNSPMKGVEGGGLPAALFREVGE
jgi:penicillin-binding protein 1A